MPLPFFSSPHPRHLPRKLVTHPIPRTPLTGWWRRGEWGGGEGGARGERVRVRGAGHRKNRLFLGWSLKKSTFLRLVIEKIDFFGAGH